MLRCWRKHLESPEILIQQEKQPWGVRIHSQREEVSGSFLTFRSVCKSRFNKVVSAVSSWKHPIASHTGTVYSFFLSQPKSSLSVVSGLHAESWTCSLGWAEKEAGDNLGWPPAHTDNSFLQLGDNQGQLSVWKTICSLSLFLSGLFCVLLN